MAAVHSNTILVAHACQFDLPRTRSLVPMPASSIVHAPHFDYTRTRTRSPSRGTSIVYVLDHTPLAASAVYARTVPGSVPDVPTENSNSPIRDVRLSHDPLVCPYDANAEDASPLLTTKTLHPVKHANACQRTPNEATSGTTEIRLIRIPILVYW